MAKQRSPNYPKFDLETALGKIEEVYKAEHTHVSAKEVVARDLGYTSLNGASLTTIGALNAYGLLVTEGNGLKVSEDAVTILELPKGHQERIDALMRRSTAPKLFSELQQEFGDTLPSDVNLRHSLIKRGFLPKSADEAIRVYRETKSFVYAEFQEYSQSGAVAPKGESKAAHGAMLMQEANARSANPQELAQMFNKHSPLSEQGKQLRFNISRNSEAHVIFSGPVTQEAIDKLAKLLELQKDTFPTKQELETTAGTPENEQETKEL